MGDRQWRGAATAGSEPAGRYLCFAEREEIALARAAGESMRSIAARLGRSPSTISRELGRNAEAPGRYLATKRTRGGLGARRAAETGEAGDEPWHAPSGELLAASEDAWRWLGWVGAIDGEAVRLPAETFGPLPAM